MTGYALGDYIQVNQRILLALAKYPEMTLQFEFKGILEHAPDYIWGIAYLYRYPDDPRPAMGTAVELAIGKTNFTRGSEMQNLESSCWGRACAAAGFGLEKSIASAEEIEFAKARQNDESKPAIEKPTTIGFETMTVKQFAMIKSLFAGDVIAMNDYVEQYKIDNDFPPDTRLSKTGASKLIEQLMGEGRVPMPNPNRNIDPESKYE